MTLRQMNAELGRLDLTEEQAQNLVISSFTSLAYGNRNLEWMGMKLQKFPSDMMVYQEIIWKTKPDVIVETGTWQGGSALFMAQVCELLNYGLVITVDLHNQWVGAPRHPRIMYITGDSADPQIFAQIAEIVKPFSHPMVILDSNHSREHVLKELDLYAPLVSVGNYLIVEDTNIHGHPVRADLPEGPWEAVHEWLPYHPEFSVDLSCERYLLTNNPHGFLKRVS
jgi:cephalosporin hydroxylase